MAETLNASNKRSLLSLKHSCGLKQTDSNLLEFKMTKYRLKVFKLRPGKLEKSEDKQPYFIMF